MSVNEFLKYAQLDDFRDDLGIPSHELFALSIFDHWLDEDEARNCSDMTFSIATEGGALEEYMRGESRFLQFYHSFASAGVFKIAPEPSQSLLAGSAEFEAVLIASLRERRFFDLYFTASGVRIRGGYDRTDQIIAEADCDISSIKVLARQCGLFILPCSAD